MPEIAKQQLSEKGGFDTSPDKGESNANTVASQKSNTTVSRQESGKETAKASSGKTDSSPNENQIQPPTQGSIYAVAPIIFLPANTQINQANYKNQVDLSFQKVQSWYKTQLGKTFNLLPAILYKTILTESELVIKYPNGGGMWYDGLGAATVANNLELCNSRRFYYFVTPLDNVWGGWVGAENLGCSHVIPGTASIPNHMGRLVGGIFDPNWPEWWADEIREAQGGVAHEIGHGLGAECVNNVCNGLPHSNPGDGSIMFEWWTFDAGGGFTQIEKAQILKSPFII